MCAKLNTLSLPANCPVSNSIVKRLVAIQRRDLLSDTKLAKILGIHRVHWARIKHGHQRPGIKVISNALRAYPDTLNDALRESGIVASPFKSNHMEFLASLLQASAKYDISININITPKE